MPASVAFRFWSGLLKFHRMRRKTFRERSESGVTVQTMLLISVSVLAVGAASVWLFNLLGDAGDSIEQASRGKLIYQADCDLEFAQPRARPLPYGMTEDANGKFLLHKIEMIGGGNRNTYYWEFPLSETLDEAREKAELNLIGQAIQGPENISLTSRVSKLRFYDKWANPFRSLSINTPQESININYRSLPQYMHPLFEDAIPDGGGTTDSFERLHPRLTAPPAGFLRLVENLVIAFNQRDGCWGFRLQGVEPPPPAATTSSTSSTSSTSTSSTTTSSTSSTTTTSTTTTTTTAAPTPTQVVIPSSTPIVRAFYPNDVPRHAGSTVSLLGVLASNQAGTNFMVQGCSTSLTFSTSASGISVHGSLPQPSHRCWAHGGEQLVPNALRVRVTFTTTLTRIYDIPLS